MTEDRRIEKSGYSLHERHSKRLKEREGRCVLYCSLLILLSICAVYGSLLRKDVPYVNYDDPMNFKHNHHVHHFSYENIKWAMMEGTRIGVYEPIANIFKMIIFAACRAADSEISQTDIPAHCIHRSSVALHAVNAILSFLLSLHFVRNTKFAALSVIFIFIHSQRVEVVAWASGIPYLICCFFVLLSVLIHIHSCRYDHNEKRSWWYLCRMISVLLFLAATMSKSMAVSAVAVHTGYDLLRALSSSSSSFTTSVTRALTQNLILILVACVSAYVAIQTSGVPADLSETKAASEMMLWQRVLVASRVLMSYLTQQFVPTFLRPFHQCVRYPLPREDDIHFENFFALSFVVVTTLSCLAVLTLLLSSYRRKYVAMTWLVYGAMILPTLGVLSGVHVSTSGADRYTYIPSVIVFVPALATLMSYTTSRGRNVTSFVVFAVSVAFIASNALSTIKSIETWSSSVTLWHVSIENCPNDIAAYSQLGVELLGHPGRRLEAIEALEKAVEMKPDFISALLNLGVALEFEGRLEEASEMHLRATRVNPVNSVAWFNAGNVLAKYASEIDNPTKRSDVVQKSANALSRAIALRSNDVGAISRLGLLLCEHESRDGQSLQITISSVGWQNVKWRTILTTALSMDLSNSAHNHNLGFCLHKLKHFKEAETEAREAIRKDPFHRASHIMLLDILKQSNDGRSRLKSALRNAISTFPSDANIFNRIASK